MKIIPPIKFPSEKQSLLTILRPLFYLIKELKKFRRTIGLGHIMSYPSRWAVGIWRWLIVFNPGNLGNWSIRDKKINNVTGKFESSVIAMMLDLYRVKKKNDWEGYFTSGTTEANIYLAWLGRKKLQNQGLKLGQIALLRNSLTHYSLTKAADVVGVTDFELPISRDWQGFSLPSLLEWLDKLKKQGYSGFLVPLTLGFTLSGTDDQIEELIDDLVSWGKANKIKFFFWIDAAFAGLTRPFIDKSFRPLNNSLISGFAVDFHKYGQVPLPAGLVFYRRDLRQLIERPIAYLTEADSTLLGSRTGVSPVAVWAELLGTGKQGYRQRLAKSLQQKQQFMDRYQQEKDLEIITTPHSVSLGLVIKRNKSHWQTYFKETHDIYFEKVKLLFPKKSKTITVGKVYFMR
jgi:glutamate/tyrosine decarboxylase-like PLP-dependent enzyme